MAARLPSVQPLAKDYRSLGVGGDSLLWGPDGAGWPLSLTRQTLPDTPAPGPGVALTGDRVYGRVCSCDSRESHVVRLQVPGLPLPMLCGAHQPWRVYDKSRDGLTTTPAYRLRRGQRLLLPTPRPSGHPDPGVSEALLMAGLWSASPRDPDGCRWSLPSRRRLREDHRQLAYGWLQAEGGAVSEKRTRDVLRLPEALARRVVRCLGFDLASRALRPGALGWWRPARDAMLAALLVAGDGVLHSQAGPAASSLLRFAWACGAPVAVRLNPRARAYTSLTAAEQQEASDADLWPLAAWDVVRDPCLPTAHRLPTGHLLSPPIAGIRCVDEETPVYCFEGAPPAVSAGVPC